MMLTRARRLTFDAQFLFIYSINWSVYVNLCYKLRFWLRSVSSSSNGSITNLTISLFCSAYVNLMEQSTRRHWIGILTLVSINTIVSFLSIGMISILYK